MELMSKQKSRIPIGIAIIVIFLALGSIILAGAVIMRIAMPAKFSSSEPAWLLAGFMVIFAGLFAWTAIGLWRLQNWAWRVVLFTISLIFLIMSANLIQHRVFPNPKTWWHFYLYPVIFGYLFLPSIRRIFKK